MAPGSSPQASHLHRDLVSLRRRVRTTNGVQSRRSDQWSGSRTSQPPPTTFSSSSSPGESNFTRIMAPASVLRLVLLSLPLLALLSLAQAQGRQARGPLLPRLPRALSFRWVWGDTGPDSAERSVEVQPGFLREGQDALSPEEKGVGHPSRDSESWGAGNAAQSSSAAATKGQGGARRQLWGRRRRRRGGRRRPRGPRRAKSPLNRRQRSSFASLVRAEATSPLSSAINAPAPVALDTPPKASSPTTEPSSTPAPDQGAPSTRGPAPATAAPIVSGATPAAAPAPCTFSLLGRSDRNCMTPKGSTIMYCLQCTATVMSVELQVDLLQASLSMPTTYWLGRK